MGGGIAGVTCLDTILDDFDPSAPKLKLITLVSESKLVKKVVNYSKRGRNLESFEIQTDDALDAYKKKIPEGLDFRLVTGRLHFIDTDRKSIQVDSHKEGTVCSEKITIDYDILCLCLGSSPKRSNLAGDNNDVLERILTIRDTTSVAELKQRLADVNTVTIVGNGGISLELVSKLQDCEIAWIIRDEIIGHPFLDSGASDFLLRTLDRTSSDTDSRVTENRIAYTSDNGETSLSRGPALGPYWLQDMELIGRSRSGKKLSLYRGSEIVDISYNGSNANCLSISLQDNSVVECDLIILAIGVEPNRVNCGPQSPRLSQSDGGILIDVEMRTTVEHIYAAGDVVSCDMWPKDTLWFQMRLWTQARQMGYYCGKCVNAHLANENPSIYANFECFTHVTSFFDHELVLLGRYTDQYLVGLDVQKLEILARISRGKEYIKLVLYENRVIGAIIIGETGLEETIENLIHDQIDVSDFKDQLLDNTIDVEDFFD